MADAPVVLVAYDREWPRQFEAERGLLNGVLAPWLDGGIHHVGSTAVPGIVAKPIIDMVAGVHDLQDSRAAFDPLREQLYEYGLHRSSAHWFYKHPSRWDFQHTHHLHLTEPGSDLWRERLAFRDALRADPALMAEYEALKLGLAEQQREGRSAYTTAAKRPFVARALASVGIQLRPR